MKNNVGDMAWLDLTIKNAEQVQDFYCQVVGWKSEGCDMGGYQDYTMLNPSSGDATAGVCHSSGVNADLPPAWLPYFLVANIDKSVAAVLAQGGELVTEIKSMGADKYVVIKDPAGAVCALYHKNSDTK